MYNNIVFIYYQKIDTQNVVKYIMFTSPNIKRPVTAYGSILLGELVAILSVMEYLIVNSSQIQHREIRIFSDSQTAVGIITLNCVSNHYLDVIKKINDNMSSLESKGWKLEIVWTPGHSEVQGNDVADRLAKEAAMEGSGKRAR